MASPFARGLRGASATFATLALAGVAHASIWSTGFESGDPVGTGSGSSGSWHVDAVSACEPAIMPQTGSQYLHEGADPGAYEPNVQYDSYTLPTLDLRPYGTVTMAFGFQTRLDPAGNDGFNVKISSDGGSSWTLVTPMGGYPSGAIESLDDVFQNEPGYGQSNAGWSPAVFDMTLFAGLPDVRVRFVFGSDAAIEDCGVFIDDLDIAGTQAAPPDPQLLRPSDDARFFESQPRLGFFGSDPEGDGLVYDVQWTTDPTFAVAEMRSSDVDPGFANDEDPGDASPFTPGQVIVYDIDTELGDDSTYYWRVRATDPAGSATPSNWSAPFSFTRSSTEAPPPPLADWFQGSALQFEGNTLQNAMVAADTIVISDELQPATVTTDDIVLADLTLDPATQFTGWARVVVDVTHPDEATTVQVDVFDGDDNPIGSSGVSSGAGTHDVPVDLTGETAPVIYLVVTMTPGSSPQINSITVQGSMIEAAPALGRMGATVLAALLLIASLVPLRPLQRRGRS